MKKLINTQWCETKFASPILIIILLITNISASDLELKLSPHYFLNGQEINYDNSTIFTGISFDVLGSNNLPTQRILSLSIVNASPIELYNSLNKETIPFIRILQKDALLYSSSIIPTSSFNESEINFSISIIGLSESNWTLEDAEATKNILIKNKEENKIKSFGGVIFPSHPELGLVILIGLSGVIIFCLWDFNIFKKLNLWKRKRQLKKMDKTQMEERRRQR